MKYLFLIFISLFPGIIYSQIFSGKVTDQQNIPVSFANVLLLDKDSTFLTGDISREDGTFQLSVTGKPALLKVSCIGYRDEYLALNGKTEVGIIHLKEETEQLEEVVVKGNLPVTRIKGDALVTSIENSVLSKVGSANDVLAKIPGLTRNDDSFEVFGKGEPLIYINGRKLRNRQELEQLSSEDIKNVELVTNPGARYDAEVKAVVRIQTVKRKGDGLGIDLRSSYYQSQNTDLIEQLDFNYRHNSLNVFGGVSYNRMEKYFNEKVEQHNEVGDVWVQENTNDQNQRYYHVDVNAGFNFMLAEDHSLGARYDFVVYPSDWTTSDISSLVRKNNLYYDDLSGKIRIDQSGRSEHYLNAYYHGKAGRVSIDWNADYFQGDSEGENINRENSAEHEFREVRSLNPVHNRLGATKLEFVYPFGRGKLSWGAEYTYTLRRDNYLSFAETYVPTSYSKIREHNAALFAEYSQAFPFGQLSAGLRYEHVDFDYYKDHRLQEDQSRTYDNLYPNLSFATKAGQIRLMASYTAKTKRPSYSSLSNNVVYLNRFTRTTGDPALLPALTHDVTLVGAWRFVQMMVSFQQQRDANIRWSNPIEESPEVVMIRQANLDKLPKLSVMLAAAPTIGCWSPVFSAGLQKQWLDMENANVPMRLDKPMWVASFKNTVSLPAGFILNADLSFSGKGNMQNIYVARNRWICDLSLQKSFLKDALSVEIRGTDLLQGEKTDAVLYMNTLRIDGQSYSDSREFVLTVRYKFNTTKSKYKGSGAGAEQRSRF